MRRTMTRYQISFAVAILAMSASLAGQSEPPKVSVVTFEFVASIGGEPLSGRFVLDSSNGRIHDGKVTGELTLSLPYGKYLALYQDNFFAPISREVIVDRPEALFVLSEPLKNFTGIDTPPSDPFAISVRVQPAKPCAPGTSLWVELVGVYSTYSAERKIGPNGFALFDAIDDGSYVLMILDGTQTRATQLVKTDRKVTTVSITPQDCK
jgi:hypothetical protein